jgi:hypothetical protein
MSNYRLPIILVTMLLAFVLASRSMQAVQAAEPEVPKGTEFGGKEAADLPALVQDEIKIYLPLVMKNRIRYASGQITDRNIPLAGQLVELLFNNSVDDWKTWDVTFTDSQGYYVFEAPESNEAEKYYVRWENTMNGNDPDRLWSWECSEVDVSSQAAANLCNFDVEDVELLTPASGSTVLLPYTFTWQPRLTAADSYELILQDWVEATPIYYSPMLGYFGSFALNSLPPGFLTDTEYLWFVTVYGSNGRGYSYAILDVTFQSGSPADASEAAETFNLQKQAALRRHTDERLKRLGK